jgi:PAS domain S-box-containing protein
MAPANPSDRVVPFEFEIAGWRDRARYGVVLIGVGLAYVALAKLGLALASINPSASPIWPPTGLAVAAVLLCGYRVWPAVFIGAFVVNVTTAGSPGTSFAIALGNTLECVVTAALLRRPSGRLPDFETPVAVVRFAALCLTPGPLISATLGVGSLALAGFADRSQLASIWLTWWLGDATGALVITPVIVLWATAPPQALRRDSLIETAAVVIATVLIGMVAFSPLIEQTVVRGPLSFLAILPLILAAMRRGPRDTATVALILSCFAVWGTLMNGGPFAGSTLNDSFLLLLAFIISTSVPSLVLSADVAMRKRIQDNLRAAHQDLDRRVRQRTEDLGQAIGALQSEVEERREIEAKLQEQSVHLLEAQRLANLGSWTWDIATKKVTWSQQIYQIYGASRESFRGTFEDYLERVHPDDRERVRNTVMAAFESGNEFQLDERIVRPDGEIRYLHSTGEVIRNERGEAIRMLGICYDVTERRTTEAALDEAREKLAQAQKMEALGQLTGGIAHDFNNLLMIVSGHAQILRRGLTDEKQMRAIEAITTAASRGENLTRQLLAFSRRQRLTPVVIDLKERIQAVREMLGSSLRGNIQLICDMPEGLWPTEVDLSELELALVNVAVNARDAMPDGGKIRLSVRNVTLKAGGPLRDLVGDFVAIDMADTGAGIPRDVLPRVFEPFFTTKSVGKGTGLGLSQVYGFAHQSGGSVTIDSEPGRGTTITIFLPRSLKPVARTEPAAGAHQRRGGEGSILVVEDNLEVAEVTAALLAQLGYRVIRAESAADALARLERVSVDLVFSDIVMPGPMDGLALAKEIRARHPDVPVLLTSGYSVPVPGSESEFQILRKPFELSALETGVREALRRPPPRGAAAAGGSPG